MPPNTPPPNAHPGVADTYRLRLPGPIAVPERVRLATARPMLNHRGPEFRAIWARTIARLQPIVGTRQPVHIFATSGSGVMEAALLNIVAPGERLLIVCNGNWGERFASIGKTMGAVIDSIDVPWGENVDAAVLDTRLKAHDYRALIVIHNESSTGNSAISPPPAVSSATRRRCSSPIACRGLPAWTSRWMPGASISSSLARRRR